MGYKGKTAQDYHEGFYNPSWQYPAVGQSTS